MDNHTEFAMSVMESNYLPTAEFVLTDGVIELEYSEHAEAESPGTYVWIAERTECEPGVSAKVRVEEYPQMPYPAADTVCHVVGVLESIAR